MEGERALEVGQDLVAVLAEVLGDHDEALDGSAGVAGVVDGDSDAVVGVGEGGVGIAVEEVAVADDVGADFGVERGGVGGGRRGRVDDRVELPVLDFDSVECVFSRVAVAGYDNRCRLARVARPTDGECEVSHRLLHARDEWPRPSGDVFAGQDGNDIGRRMCSGRVDGDDLRVHMGRTQHGSVGGTGTLLPVVGEAPAPGDQGCVLYTLDRAADVHQ